MMNQTLDNVRLAVEQWGAEMVAAMRAALPHEKDTTGALRNSISFSVSMMGTQVHFQFSLADYYKYIDQGRKPGKFPPPDAIRQWIMNKKLQIKLPAQTHVRQAISHHSHSLKSTMPRHRIRSTNPREAALKSLTFLIGRKIAKKGVEAVPFYTNTLTPEALNDLNNRISEAFKKDVQIQVNTIKNLMK